MEKSNISESPPHFRHQIQFSAVKEDCCSEIVLVSVSTRRAFDNLDFAVQTFGCTIRYSIHDCSQNSCPMAFQSFRGFPDRFQSGMGSSSEPLFEVSGKFCLLRSNAPQSAQQLFNLPCSCRRSRDGLGFLELEGTSINIFLTEIPIVSV